MDHFLTRRFKKLMYSLLCICQGAVQALHLAVPQHRIGPVMLQVFFVCADGSVFALCPVAPFQATVSLPAVEHLLEASRQHPDAAQSTTQAWLDQVGPPVQRCMQKSWIPRSRRLDVCTGQTAWLAQLLVLLACRVEYELVPQLSLSWGCDFCVRQSSRSNKSDSNDVNQLTVG